MAGRLLRLAAVLAACLLLAACAPAETQRTVLALDTMTSMRVWARDGEAVCDALQALLAQKEALYTAYGTQSDIGRLNSLGEADVSPETFALLQQSLALGEATGGAFNPCMLPAMRAWGFRPDGMQDRRPSERERADLAVICDMSGVRLTAPAHVQLKPGVALDLGGIAKGRVGQEIYDWLSAHRDEFGIRAAIITLGGNVVAFGARPDGSDWRVGVRNPSGGQGIVGYVQVSDAHVVTAGDSERFYVAADGMRVGHILDPRVMAPADAGLLSATIIARDGAVADALCTAVFVLGEEKGTSLLRERFPEVGYVLCRTDGTHVCGGAPQLCRFTAGEP